MAHEVVVGALVRDGLLLLAHRRADELRWVSADEIPGLHLAHAAYQTFLPGLLTADR